MSEPILFVKPGCPECDYVKARLPQGRSVRILDVETPEGLAELAYRELVGPAEKALPILLKEDPAGVGATVVYAGAVLVLRALAAKPQPPTEQKETAMQPPTEVITAGDSLHRGTQPSAGAQGDSHAVPMDPPARAPQEVHIQGKTCRKCGKTHTLTHFSPRKDAPDGRENTCRTCRNQDEHARADRERAAATLNFSILDEVARTQESHQRDYGDPVAFFEEAANFASLLMRKEVSAADCIRILIALVQTCEAVHPAHKHRVALMNHTATLDQLQK